MASRVRYGRPVVVGDLAGVDLVREADADLVEDVEDRVPAVGEVLVARLDHRGGHRREHRHRVPDRRAGEADHRVDAEQRPRPARCSSSPRRPPGVRPRGRPRPRCGRAGWPCAARRWGGRRRPGRRGGWRWSTPSGRACRAGARFALDVGRVGERLVDLEVVAPAGDLEPVVAPFGGQPAHLLERQVGPLAGEQRDRSCIMLPPPVTREAAGQSAALRSTAASTRCTRRPSANDGARVGRPAAIASRKSLISWVKVCS